MKRDVYKYAGWSLRCYICDHCYTTPESDYNNLEVPVQEGPGAGKHRAKKQKKNTSWVGMDRETGKPICKDCWASIFGSVQEMEWLDKLDEPDTMKSDEDPNEEDQERSRR